MKKKLQLKNFLNELVSLIESSTISRYSKNTIVFFIIIHQIQLLSYLIKMDSFEYTDSKLHFLTYILFYSNFFNFLYLFQSDKIAYCCLFLIIILLLSFIFLIFLITILKRFKYISENSKIYINSAKFIGFFVNIYYWVLYIPFLELFNNLLDCDWYSYFSKCDERSIIIYIFSIVGIFLSIFFLLIVLWANRSYSFLEKSCLKFKLNTFFFISLFAKTIIICCFSFLHETNSLILYVLLNLAGLLGFYESIFCFPMVNNYLKMIFHQIITVYLVICLLFTFKENNILIKELNIFYCILVLSVISLKISIKIHDIQYKKLLFSNFKNISTVSILLDEFYDLSNKINSKKSIFLNSGLLRNHFIDCKLNDCYLTKEKYEKFDKITNIEQLKMLNNFISETFIRNLKEKKSIKKKSIFEELLLKYGSFITHFNSNSIKAYYEIQHIFSLNQEKSIFFNSISKNLIKDLKKFIVVYEKENQNQELSSKEIDIKSFADMTRTKKELTKKMIELLKKKEDFYDKYKEGVNSYNELLKNIKILSDEINNYEKLLLEKKKLSMLFPLKFQAILSVIVMNHINEGLKLEDTLYKMKKRELSLEKDSLNLGSFYNEKAVFMQASFLSQHGILIENCRTEKLASFFGYNNEEIKNIRHISQFMPGIVKANHSKFFDWYINKPRTSKTKEKRVIKTFVLNKIGFIFPISLYKGHCFEYNNDFVFHSLILDVSGSNDRFLLFSNEGNIEGVTINFFQLINIYFPILKPLDLNLLNIYCLAPNLKEIINKNKGFADRSLTNLSNQTIIFYLPKNLEEIIEIIKTKEKDAEIMKSYHSSRSNKTAKSQKSLHSNKSVKEYVESASKNSKFMSKFFKTTNFTQDQKENFQRKYLNNDLGNIEILKELVDKKFSYKIKINFDISFHFYTISSASSIDLANLSINKYFEQKQAIPQKLNLQQIDQFEISNKENSPRDEEILFTDCSDVKSSFINMPPANFAAFRSPKISNCLTPLNSDSSKPEIHPTINFQTDSNKLLTTENAEPKSKQNNLKIIQEKSNSFQDPSSQNLESHLSDKDDKDNKGENLESFNSSLSRERVAKEGIEIGKTSNEKIIDLKDISSQNSSMSSLKKTYGVYSLIRNIQGNLPLCIYHVILNRIIDIFIIITFCVVMTILTKQYVESYYKPLEEALINFSELQNSLCNINLIGINRKLNIYNVSFNNDFVLHKNFIIDNVERGFTGMKNMIEKERTKENLHNYQIFFKNSEIETRNVLGTTLEINNFVNEIDELIAIIHDFKTLDEKLMDNWKIDYFYSGFSKLDEKIEEIQAEISKEFYDKNDIIFNTLKILMIVFIILIFILKMIEIYKLDVYFQRITRLMTIFLRVSQNEAFNEVLISKETRNHLENSFDKYLNVNYSDLILTRKAIKMIDENDNLNKSVTSDKTGKKKIRKNSNKRTNLRQLSRFLMITFALIFFFMIFSYIFFNYLYCTIVNNTITDLIDINKFFQNLYTLPQIAIVYKNSILFESLFPYESTIIKVPYKETLSVLMKSRYQELVATTEIIPQYTLNIQTIINNPDFDELISGNVCSIIKKNGKIKEEEINNCIETLNGAFLQGFLGVTVQIINEIGLLNDILFSNNPDKEQIKKLFNEENINFKDISIATFVYDGLKIFYDIVEKHYTNEMIQELNNLHTIVIVTCVLLVIFLGIVAIFSLKHWKKLYRSTTLTLSLIPYDRLINDEQTIFLIKRYWKE